MLKKIAYTFTVNRDEQRQLDVLIKNFATLCDSLAALARDYHAENDKLPTTIDLNNLARKQIDTQREGIPYRYVGLAASRVTKMMKSGMFPKFYDQENGLVYSVDLDEKTFSVALKNNTKGGKGIRDYPRLECSIATWDGRSKHVCEVEEVDEYYLDELQIPDRKAGYPLLVRLRVDINKWGVVLTVND